jgi:hypothetical protein
MASEHFPIEDGEPTFDASENDFNFQFDLSFLVLSFLFFFSERLQLNGKKPFPCSYNGNLSIITFWE